MSAGGDGFVLGLFYSLPNPYPLFIEADFRSVFSSGPVFYQFTKVGVRAAAGGYSESTSRISQKARTLLRRRR